MKNSLYDALEVYFRIKKQDKKIEELTESEIKAYTLITRDNKMMSILNSFEPGITPSLVDIVPRYNALLDQENKAKNVILDNDEQINPSQKIEEPIKNAKVPKLVNKNPDLSVNKLNQVGYANIVLMSIIVIIIVAIICVFIFAN